MRQNQNITWHDNPFQSTLLPQERILWQGKPARGILLGGIDFFLIPFTFLWGIGAFAGVVNSIQKEPENLLNFVIGIPFVFMGIYMMFGRFLVDMWVRRNMSYAVTNKRILIKRNGLFAQFTSIKLNALTDVQMNRSLYGGTLRFSAVKSFNNMGISMSPSLDRIPQFIGIEQSEKVLNIITCMKDVTVSEIVGWS